MALLQWGCCSCDVGRGGERRQRQWWHLALLRVESAEGRVAEVVRMDGFAHCLEHANQAAHWALHHAQPHAGRQQHIHGAASVLGRVGAGEGRQIACHSAVGIRERLWAGHLHREWNAVRGELARERQAWTELQLVVHQRQCTASGGASMQQGKIWSTYAWQLCTQPTLTHVVADAKQGEP